MAKIINATDRFSQPCITIRVTSSQSIPNGVDTALNAHNTVLVNKGGDVISVANGVFTVNSAGLYHITGDVSFATNATGHRSMYFVKSNDSSYSRGRTMITAISGNNTLLNATDIFDLIVGETVQTNVYQNSGGALNIIANSTWAAAEITLMKI